MTDSSDLLRRVAVERGRLLAELGVRVDDTRWTKLEAETISSLVTPQVPLRLPRRLKRLFGRIRRVLGR
jgi:hypothetical protein